MKPSTRKGQALPPDVEQMVQQIASDAPMTALALLPAQRDALRAIVLRARHTPSLNEPRASSTSKPAHSGVTAVFAGADRTARTNAAAVLAGEM